MDPKHWRAARNALVKYAERAPLEYVWRNLQDVVGAWQRKRKVAFVALPAYDRGEIIAFLHELR